MAAAAMNALGPGVAAARWALFQYAPPVVLSNLLQCNDFQIDDFQSDTLDFQSSNIGTSKATMTEICRSRSLSGH